MSIFNDIAAQHEREVSSGSRFRFGRNWAHFLRRLNDARIIEAENNLNQFLGEGSLADKTFLDIGSGSGLSSLAARRLGATVLSFDFDSQSVACTEELRRRYRPGDGSWRIDRVRCSTRSILPASASWISFIHGACCIIRVQCGRRWKM